MQYFFSKNILNDKIILSQQESIHCIKVLRHSIGDIIYIVNGLGIRFTAKILNVNNNCVEAEIIDQKNICNKSNVYIHIVIAPTKSSQRFEWFVEKAVEIGVDEISFFKSSNSERTKINIERIKKIALTAMKQSLRASMPKINDIEDISKVVGKISQQNRYIGYLNDISNDFLHDIAPKNSDYCLIIGPEGDFSENEISIFLENNFIPVLLGKFRLRTETAAIAGCLALNQINYDK